MSRPDPDAPDDPDALRGRFRDEDWRRVANDEPGGPRLDFHFGIDRRDARISFYVDLPGNCMSMSPDQARAFGLELIFMAARVKGESVA